MTADNLSKPDPRSIKMRRTIEDLHSRYFQMETRLSSRVPPQLRKRLTNARDLGIYAWFNYEFHMVSFFWSISCIEMALRAKFSESNPGPFAVERKSKTETAQGDELLDRLRKKDGGSWECQTSTAVLSPFWFGLSI